MHHPYLCQAARILQSVDLISLERFIAALSMQILDYVSSYTRTVFCNPWPVIIIFGLLKAFHYIVIQTKSRLCMTLHFPITAVVCYWCI